MLRRSKPTRQQLQDWDDTRAALMHFAPALTHIFYTLMNKDENYIAVFTDDPGIPTAATDSVSIVINTTPGGYFKYNLMERLFILAHEILHNILNHILLLRHVSRSGKVVLADGRVFPFIPDLFQIALDLVVNAILIEAKIGKAPNPVLYDLSLATARDSVLDVYAKFFKSGGGGKLPGSQPGDGDGDGDEEGEGEGKGEGSAPGGFDTHLEPGAADGKTPNEAEGERNQAEWDTVIKAAMEMAKGQGKLPACLERIFEEIVEDKVDWSDVVQAWFARKVGSGSWDWKHPDRKLIVRDIWAPGRSGYGAGLIVIGCDTSGSIGQKEVSLWMGVLANILQQLRPRQIIVIWCDAAVGRVDEIEDASDLETIRKQGAPGGGGTSFLPVFDYIAEHRLEPDALVYLTDGYGDFPRYAPQYPVFWGGLEGTLDPGSYPFGEVVVVPTK
jgi:predicted metal-dependent peptidase